MTDGATPTPPVSWLDDLPPTSEMARLVARFAWSTSALGHPDSWSTSLRAAVRTCLSTRFPMLVAWGPDLAMIYNDGYRDMLGTELHPYALGRPMHEVWHGVWGTIGPMLRSVVETGVPTWVEDQPLALERNGYVEDTWFTYSYSPIVDDDGTVGGVLDTCAETTSQVVMQQRLACLGALGAAALRDLDPVDVCRRAVDVLRRWRGDLRWADVHLLVDGNLSLVASSRAATQTDAASFGLAARASESGLLERRAMSAAGAPGDVVAIPLGTTPRVGVLVVGLSTRRQFDEPYAAFVELCAQSIGGALEAALSRTVEIERLREVSDVLQRAMLAPASATTTVAARYVPADGHLSVGGDWYDVVELGAERHALVVGDCVGHGLEAAAVMGQLRSAARALLLDGLQPAGVLEAMDRFAGSVGGTCATMVCAIVDHGAAAVTHASAGHLPILVVDGETATWLPSIQGLPLAVGSRGRVDTVTALGPAASLVLYSDGLVERRSEVIDVGLARLRDAALALAGCTAQEFADGLLERVVGAERSDDIVLVVDRLDAVGATPTRG